MKTKISRDPIDKLAKIVIQRASGLNRHNEHEDPGKKHLRNRIILALQQKRIKPINGACNYVGQTRGDVKVIFYAGWNRRPDGEVRHFWLVKCRCGNYEIRTTRALSRNAGVDKCEDCKQTEFLRNRAALK